MKTVTHAVSRRQLIKAGFAGAAAVALGGAMRPARAAGEKILIGYWPVASGLPFYTALERGYFKEAGLNVEGVKLASAQQVIEAMVAGRIHGSANGTASASLALGEIMSPGLFKIICANPSSRSLVLDEVLVPAASTVQKISELAGKRFACGPGIQNVTIAKLILEKNGIENPKVIELPIGQHVPALAANQVDAVYTLEPTGTVGRLNGTARVLETGVVSHYMLGDPEAPWYGGSASLLSSLIKERPADVEKYITAYRTGVKDVLERPADVRRYLTGHTSVAADLVNEVPMIGYTMYDEFKPSDVDYFQKYFDVFTERKIFSRRLEVAPLIYKA